MGFYPTTLRKCKEAVDLRANCLSELALAADSQCSSFPVASHCGGWKQGQNRDKNQASSAAWLLLFFTFLVGLAAKANDPADSDNEPVPRAKKKERRRSREEQGLPDDDELVKLAENYLVRASKVWPEVVSQGLIPKPTTQILEQMAAQFKERHLASTVNPEGLEKYHRLKLPFGADYPRFSDENSDPKSIVDQLNLALQQAKADGCFIPWDLIVADYARSATHGHRQGFETLLNMIKSPELRISTVYVDDFQRASRNSKDAWKLAALCKKHRIRLVGVSDGFNLDGEDWDMKVSFYSFFNRLETKNKRQRVKRGMGGSAADSRTLGKLPFGYARKTKYDAKGNAEYKPNGQPKTQMCIDPAMQDVVKSMFDLFCEKKWSAHRICKMFNEEKIEGWDGWTEGAIRRILVNPIYIGLRIWNRTRNEIDPETEKQVTLQNPWQDWKRERDPELQLVSKSQHVYARNKLVKQAKTRTRKSHKAPATLFSKILVCEYCGSEIKLIRSAGVNKSMACFDGNQHIHGCRLNASKSVRVIETCLLNYLTERLFTKEYLTELVKKANRYLTKEAKKPRADVKPFQRRRKEVENEINTLMKRLGKLENESLCEAYEDRICKCQEELRKLMQKIADGLKANAPPPPAIDLSRVEEYLKDLRTVLGQEVPAAAEALRTLTGPISISQQPYPDGRRGAQWIAKFSPNLMRLLSKIGRAEEYPDCITLEFLCNRIWSRPVSAEVVIDSEPRYEQFAEKFKRLHDAGVSYNSIAAAHKCSYELVVQSIRFATTGQRPSWRQTAKKRPAKPNGGTKAEPKYVRFAELVVKLRDEEKMTFDQIAAYIKEHHQESIAVSTLGRAYDYGRPAVVENAVAEGKPLHRGRVMSIGKEKQLHDLVLANPKMPASQVAAQIGCSARTVARMRQKLFGKRKSGAA